MINDCSPNTDCHYQDIRNKYSPFLQIVYLENKKNSGTGITRQTGLDAVKEDYVIFHDDDDYLYDNYVIENYLNVIKENPNVDIAFGRIVSAWNDIIDPVGKNRNLFRGQLISKKFIDKYHLKFDKAVSYMGEDYVFFHKMKYYADVNNAEIIYINKDVYVDNNYSDFITLTAGMIPENYSENHHVSENKKLTKIVFDKIKIYYELIKFYRFHTKKLQKKHIHIVYSILKTVFNLSNLWMNILEKYGIIQDYSKQEIIELYKKWLFLLFIIKNNQDKIESWIYDFDVPKEYQSLLKLNKKIPFSEFYENFDYRFNNILIDKN